jgi:GDP-L-fucose synthase
MDERGAQYDLKGKRVYIAGHRGMVGSALQRRLGSEDCDIITAPREMLDLRHQSETHRFLADIKPHAVFVAAAKVGGIHANSNFPVEFLQDNLLITANVIEGSFKVGVEKLEFLGSSCIYPRDAPQPMNEEMLLTGPLEPTNEWYAIAKIAGIKLCDAYRREHGQNYISVMPTNLYGAGDNYDPENAHVPAALIRRFHEAKIASAPSATVWGTGKPRREFMFVDDLADACVFVMKNWSAPGFINIGVGTEVTIAEFARLVADTVGYKGNLQFDTSRPDGSPRKLLNVSKLTSLGWKAKTSLTQGLTAAYADFLTNRSSYLSPHRLRSTAQ